MRKAINDLVRLLNARKMMYKNVYLQPREHSVNRDDRSAPRVSARLHCPDNRRDALLPENLVKYYLLADTGIYVLLHMIMIRGDIGALRPDKKELAREGLKNFFIHCKPVWKKLDTFTYNLRKARHIFGRGFGGTIQEAIKKSIKEDVSQALKSKDFGPDDIHIVIQSIDVYPSASREYIRKLILLKMSEDVSISSGFVDPEEFALRHGLAPEALFTVYLNQSKYRVLGEGELEKARNIIVGILEDAVGEKKEEAPETS